MDEFAVPTGIDWRGDVGVVQYGGGDRGMVCMFYNRPVHDPIKSKETGRPWSKDVVYVRIHPPGEKYNIIDRPARDDDKRRWPMQWRQFQENREQIPDGTPIELLYPEHPSVAATLRANAVHTVEQCAALSGPAIDSIGLGAQQYANDAKRYLEVANKGVSVTHMRTELEQRDRELSTLRRQMSEVVRINEQLRAQVGQMANTSGQVLDAIARNMSVPTHLPGRSFDPQAAMINSTHPTSDIADQAKKPSRRRAKIG